VIELAKMVHNILALKAPLWLEIIFFLLIAVFAIWFNLSIISQ